ncbi:hypothetical protein BC826DRAFT_413784 [Russula brevipes]|nr:hypothetical protein BC826DRAFT_413784 [Russula brevipes]
MRYQPSQTVRFARLPYLSRTELLPFTLCGRRRQPPSLRAQRRRMVMCSAVRLTPLMHIPRIPHCHFSYRKALSVFWSQAGTRPPMSGADGEGNSAAFTNREKKDISQCKVHTAQQVRTHNISASHFAKSLPKNAVNGRHRMLVDSACGEHLHRHWDWTLRVPVYKSRG